MCKILATIQIKRGVRVKENIEEDFRLFQLVKEEPVRSCVELSQKMRGKKNGIIYFTESFRIDYENRMYKISELQKENEELKGKLKATTLIVRDETVKMYEETEMELETRITELEEKNKELKMLMAHKNGYTQQLEQDLYENGSNYVIPKQKIKDKIEEVKNEEDLYARGNIIAILQELLEEEK